MTETEWLACEDPARMLKCIRDHLLPGKQGGFIYPLEVSDRKLWLFVAAVKRLWWGEMASPRDRKEVERLEVVADGKLEPGRLSSLVFSYTMPGDAADCARECVRVHDSKGDPPRWANLLREIVGNPWRPHARWNGGAPIAGGWTAIPDDWLTPAVLSVARAAYDLREWDRLPVLADALEDAGCEDLLVCPYCEGRGEWEDVDEDGKVVKWCPPCSGSGLIAHPVLAHLRGPGPHVRGCWALDLLLGLG
jgi:hypothetical protein